MSMETEGTAPRNVGLARGPALLTSSRGAKAASCLILVVWWWLHLRHSSTWLLTHCCGCAGGRGLGALLTTWFRCSRYCAGIGLL